MQVIQIVGMLNISQIHSTSACVKKKLKKKTQMSGETCSHVNVSFKPPRLATRFEWPRFFEQANEMLALLPPQTKPILRNMETKEEQKLLVAH